jgi:uncharacterized protein (DUF305 family)
MNAISKTALAIAMVSSVAACNGAADNQADQSAEDATENVAAAAAGPFAGADQRMSQAMMAAVGTDAGDSWAKKIVAHHQGAIEMSEIALEQRPRADVADMARMTIEKQRKDIEDIRKLFKTGSPNQQSAEIYREAMMTMHHGMQAATGTDLSETFLRKMLEHHKGAVAMSDIALQNGVSGALRKQVQKTRDDQRKEIQMVEAMLRGETMPHAMHEAGAKSVEQGQTEAPPEQKARAQPKSAPKPSATKPKAAPTGPMSETPDPVATCTAEHRALGHC